MRTLEFIPAMRACEHLSTTNLATFVQAFQIFSIVVACCLHWESSLGVEVHNGCVGMITTVSASIFLFIVLVVMKLLLARPQLHMAYQTKYFLGNLTFFFVLKYSSTAFLCMAVKKDLPKLQFQDTSFVVHYHAGKFRARIFTTPFMTSFLVDALQYARRLAAFLFSVQQYVTNERASSARFVQLCFLDLWTMRFLCQQSIYF